MFVLVFKYFFVILLFLIHALLELESACLELKECRVRESKVLAKMKVKRLRKNVLLSLVWPYRAFRILRVALSYLRKQ